MNETYLEKLSDERWDKKRKTILSRDHCQCRMCGATSIELEVHHRYYIYNAEPWDYHDDALVTLCSECHSLLHLTLPPIVYIRSNGNFIRMNFTPCHRCNGRGFLKEYRHIQGGMCFRCHGFKYEELIDHKWVDVSIDNYIICDNVFDIIFYKLDQNACKRHFAEAKKYQFGLDGNLFSIEEAMYHYNIAALNGYKEAQNNLGLLFQAQSKKIKDLYVALRWFTYGALQGLYPAMNNICNLLKHPDITTYCNKNELIDRWQENAKKIFSEDEQFERMLDYAYVFKHGNEDALRYYLTSKKITENDNKIH